MTHLTNIDVMGLSENNLSAHLIHLAEMHPVCVTSKILCLRSSTLSAQSINLIFQSLSPYETFLNASTFCMHA